MLTRKREMRVKIEKIEGTPDGASLADGDAILALDPTVAPTREKIEIPGLGKSLSREVSQFGHPAVKTTLQMLLRSSRVAPVTSAPDWALLLEACGMRETQLAYFILDAGATGTYVHGETINFAGSGATGKVIGRTVAGTGVRVYYELLTGTPADTDTVTGADSGASGSITPTDQAGPGGYKYTPDSETASSVAIGSFDAGDPAAGDVVRKAGAEVWGVVIDIDSDNGILYYVPVWDDFQSGDSITVVTGANAGSVAVSSAAPTQSRTPSISLEDRVDGLRRLIAGIRGTWSLAMQAGQPARIAFDLDGVLFAEDTLPLGSPSLTTAGGLIFRAARLSVDGRPMKLAAFDIALGAQVAARLDASAAKGVISYRLTDRQPTLRINPERVVPGIYDFDEKWDASTTFKVVTELGGTTEGERIIIETPKAHITELSDEDRDGMLAANINCDLTRDVAGDDELVIYAV